MAKFLLKYKLEQEFTVEVDDVENVEQAKEKASDEYDFGLAACERAGDLYEGDFELVSVEEVQ